MTSLASQLGRAPLAYIQLNSCTHRFSINIPGAFAAHHRACPARRYCEQQHTSNDQLAARPKAAACWRHHLVYHPPSGACSAACKLLDPAPLFVTVQAHVLPPCFCSYYCCWLDLPSTRVSGARRPLRMPRWRTLLCHQKWLQLRSGLSHCPSQVGGLGQGQCGNEVIDATTELYTLSCFTQAKELLSAAAWT